MSMAFTVLRGRWGLAITLLFWLAMAPAGAQNLVTNGSMTGPKGQIMVVPGWTGVTATPDTNDANGPLQTSPGYIWFGGVPVASPDGGTWQNAFSTESFSQTVTGLTVGRQYVFSYHYASQGIYDPTWGTGPFVTPDVPNVVITGATGYVNPGAPSALFAWNTYTGTLTATSTSITILMRGPVNFAGYMAYDGVVLRAAVSDLAITKTSNLPTVMSGQPVEFTLSVTNNGPFAANGARVHDPALPGLACTALTCQATGGAACTASPTIASLQASPGLDIPVLPSGGGVTLQLTCTVTASP
ncbi:DUF11 domain-containing protein [Pseudoxanthomonas sp. Root630]|uniref:DUF11 domain-containing protein n=1 Tax=Pseudoxanthomonas sp. Root630 TaxID=1736574 RepID=UPI00138F5C9E|nr:DUF11 domain-containing protein [Pseudoxanthomonas sp. Root630]